MPDTATLPLRAAGSHESRTAKTSAVVAGGAGFIGSHLCEALLNQGTSVICIDNLSSGTTTNINHLHQDPNFLFINHDITKPFPPMPAGTTIAWVYQLAGTDLDLEHPDSMNTLLVNSIGTHNLLELAKEYNSRFVLASNADMTPSLENSTNLKKFFGLSTEAENYFSFQEASRFAESLVAEYVTNKNLSAVVVRLKDVYGPRMSLHEKTVLHDLFDQLLHKDTITLGGDGLKFLYPTYVQDVIFGILKASYTKAANAKVYFLVNQDKVTTAHFSAELVKLSGIHKEIVTGHTKEELDFPFSRFNLKETTETLNWSARVGLEAGLKKTLEYYLHPSTAVIAQSAPAPASLPPAAPLTQPTSFWQEPKKQSIFQVPQPKQTTTTQKAPLASRISPIRITLPVLPALSRAHLKGVIVSSALALLVLGVVSPVASFFIHSSLAYSDLTNGLKMYQTSSYDRSAQYSDSSAGHLGSARKELTNLSWLVALLKQNDSALSMDQFYSVSQNVATSLKQSSLVLSNLKKVLSDGNTLDALGVKNSLEEGRVNLDLARKEFVLADLNWKQSQNQHLPPFLESNKTTIAAILDNRGVVEELSSSYQTIEELVGANGSKKYFIVITDNRFQNSLGGKVSKVALLSVTAGKMSIALIEKDLSQLATERSADANDSLTALQSALESSLGVKSDGIVAFDTQAVEKLAAAAQVDTSLATSADKTNSLLLGKLPNLSFSQLLAVLDEARALSGQKHFLASSSNSSITYLLSQKVLGYQFPQVIDGEDYLYISKDSLGSGPDPDMSFVYQLNADQSGELNSNLELRFKPTSSENYKGIVKVYTPVGTSLQRITSSEKEEIPTTGSSFERWSVFSFNLELAKEKQVTLIMRLPYKISLIKDTPYTLTIPKQAGSDQLNGEVVISLPTPLRLTDAQDVSKDVRPYHVKVQSSTDYIFHGTFTNK